MKMLTTAEAAELLGVSPREVRRLSSTGVLTGWRVGSTLLIDSADVHRRQRQSRRPGRTWSARTAWSALAMLSGSATDLIDQPRRSRLLARLRSLDATQFHALAIHRAESMRFHASERAVGRVMAALVPTGVSAIADEATAGGFGLAAVTVETRVDGYLRGGLESLIARARLTPEASGNVTVRLLPDGLTVDHLLGGRPVVALDLMDSDDVRERASGREILEGLLRAL